MTRRWVAWICAVVLLLAGGAARLAWDTEVAIPAERQAAAERLADHLRRNPPRDDWTVDAVTAGPDGLRVRLTMPTVQTASLMMGPRNYRKDRVSRACPAPALARELDLGGPVSIDARSHHGGFIAHVDCAGPFGPR